MSANDPFAIEPWLSQIDWELRCEESSARLVIDKMIELGFTILTPPMPPFTVTYNGTPVLRCYLREDAEKYVSQLGCKPSYSIKEEQRGDQT
jgi:hypothetical protein